MTKPREVLPEELARRAAAAGSMEAIDSRIAKLAAKAARPTTVNLIRPPLKAAAKVPIRMS